MKEALRRAIAIRDGLNKKTGYNDTNITDGVNHLSTDNKNVFRPQFQVVNNPTLTDIVWNGEMQNYITELEYIESTGTQLIHTRFNATPTLRIVIDMQYTEPVGAISMLQGSQESSSTTSSVKRFGFGFGWDNNDQGTNTFITNIANVQNYAWSSAGFADLNRHVWDLQSGSQKIDNVEFATTTISSDRTTDLQFCLFARRAAWNNGALSDFCKMRLFSCQAYDNGVLFRNYAPSYNSFLKCNGLFDKVNKIFYPNNRLEEGYNDDFIPGPVLT